MDLRTHLHLTFWALSCLSPYYNIYPSIHRLSSIHQSVIYVSVIHHIYQSIILPIIYLCNYISTMYQSSINLSTIYQSINYLPIYCSIIYLCICIYLPIYVSPIHSSCIMHLSLPPTPQHILSPKPPHGASTVGRPAGPEGLQVPLPPIEPPDPGRGPPSQWHLLPSGPTLGGWAGSESETGCGG